MQMKAMIVGHSVLCQASVRFNRWLRPPPGNPHSNWLGKWIRSSFLELRGETHRVRGKKEADLKQICDEGPNIVVPMIGENIFLHTDPEGLAGRIVSLATMTVQQGIHRRWSYVNYCHVCVHHGAFCTKWTDVKKDRMSQYLESYSQQVSVINRQLPAVWN